MDIGTEVVVKEMPTLLGVGKVIPTPNYSHERLTWVQFRGGTIAAFEPGELQPMSELIAREYVIPANTLRLDDVVHLRSRGTLTRRISSDLTNYENRERFYEEGGR